MKIKISNGLEKGKVNDSTLLDGHTDIDGGEPLTSPCIVEA